MPTPKPSDTVPAMLTPGEAVLNEEAAELVGRDNIAKANQKGLEMRKQVQGYADGTEQVPLNQTLPSPQNAASLATSNALREGSAQAFQAKTGYKPGSALEAGTTAPPVAPASLTGGAQGSGADITKPVEIGSAIPDFSTGSATVGNTKVNKVGTSYSQGSLANMSGVKSAVGSVTQPISTGIMRGLPGVTAGATGNNEQAKANLFASTPPIPGMANNPYAFAARARPTTEVETPTQNLPEIGARLGEQMPSDEELLNLPGEYQVQGFADGTAKVGDVPELRKTLLQAKYPEAMPPGTPPVTHGFEGDPGPKPTVTGGIKARVSDFKPDITEKIDSTLRPADQVVKSGATPGFKNMASAEKGILTDRYRPNFQEVTGPYSKVPPRPTIEAGKNLVPVQSGQLVPVGNAVSGGEGGAIKGVRAVKPEVEGIVGRALQNSKAGLKPLLQGAGQAIVPLIEGASAVRDVTTPGMKAEDIAARVGEAGTRGAGALIGAEGGAALGAFGGPAAPFTVPLGAAVGGALGYAAPDIANKIQERVTGNKYEMPSDKARRLRDEGVVPKANVEPYTPTKVVPQQVENTIPTGLEAREGPVIDFSKPSVDATVGPAQNGDANFGKVVQGNGQTRVELPDAKSYIQSGDSAAMERVFKGLKERGGIVSPPPKQSEAAQKAGTTDFWLNNGYPGGAQQYMAEQKRKIAEEANAQKRNELVGMALNSGVSGSTNIADVGNMKRRQAAAQNMVAQLDSVDNAQRRADLEREQASTSAALENKKMDITAQNTAAVNKQNALHQSAQDARDQRRLEQGEETLALANTKENRESKAVEQAPIKVQYKGEKLEGPRPLIESEKRRIDRTQAAKAWQEKNSQGIMESDEEYRSKMQRFLNANMPPVDPTTGKEIEIRYDDSGTAWMAGPNGKAVPYVAE